MCNNTPLLAHCGLVTQLFLCFLFFLSRVTAVTWTKFNGLSFSFQELQYFFRFLLQLDLKLVS